MKTKLFFLSILTFSATLSISAQQIENDDLYFNAKDRAKVKASREVALSANKDIVARGIKSSDQYSGRTVNPEYTSRLNANSNSIQGSSNPYFDSEYQSTSTASNNSGYYNGYNNYYGRSFNNSYYGNSFNNPYYGNSWNSPYSSFYDYSGMYGFNPYSSFYPSYYSPFGYASSLSLGLTFGNPFYSPYYGYNSMMYGYGGMYGGYAGGIYGYPGYYPSTIIVNNGDNGSSMVYGKRYSRSSVADNPVTPGSTTDSPTAVQDPETQVYSIPTSGRTSSTQQQYYQSNWRNNPDVNTTINSSRQRSGSSYSRSESLGTQNPSWNNNGTISRQRWSSNPDGNTTINNSRQSSGSSYNRNQSLGTQNPSWNNGATISRPRESVPSNNSFGTPSQGISTPSWGGGSGISGGSSGGGSSQPSRGR